MKKQREKERVDECAVHGAHALHIRETEQTSACGESLIGCTK